MSFLVSISNLLAFHNESLRKAAEDETSGRMMQLSQQLHRLRSGEEQLKMLTKSYKNTLKKLKGLDKSGAVNLFILNELLLHSEPNLEQVSESMDKYMNIVATTEVIAAIDFSSIEKLSLKDIPIDHVAYTILKNYKDYIAYEGLLERIKELMDLAEQHLENSSKLSPEEINEVKDGEIIHLTVAQKVLALNQLMIWSGIKLEKRQGARHQRFIAALTGLSISSIKDKFPVSSTIAKANHIQNLKALIPLFESVVASELVRKIKETIKFEEEEREL